MDAILRRYAEWKGKRKAAQVIIFDGAAEIERTRAFMKGCIAGVAVAVAVFALAAPTTLSPSVEAELAQRETLLHQANDRADQAVALTEACVRTAEGMQSTLRSYQQLMRSQ
jgi:hypothetical protein